MRHIGVDLHKTNFVACFIGDDDTQHIETYPLTRDGLARFTQQLDASDELAVEATQNVHHFYDRVKAHVARVAVVDTYRFGVVAKSKKKTDKADARALARFLKLGWLPEVSVPSEQVRTLRQLLQARETLVSMRTKLKNMAHAAFSRNGVALRRASFASAAGRGRLSARAELPEADRLVLDVALRQIAQLDAEIKAVEAEVVRRGKSLRGVSRLLQVHGLNLLSAISLLAEVGERRALRHVEAVSLLRGAGDLDAAVERDDPARRDHEAGAQAAAHRLHPGGAGDGQPHGHAADGVLPKEEAGEGVG